MGLIYMSTPSGTPVNFQRQKVRSSGVSAEQVFCHCFDVLDELSKWIQFFDRVQPSITLEKSFIRSIG